ncbi:hypothetical protein GCM10010435_36090 [Winogradskya consettensis]|uniref:Cation/H+ exchanger transmembrane domain-containing protein n=1 Tax=Winogradskya consettensis TaxID=113560 RepID=A0A919S9X3_9ACTN|nr:cation:proton antiporter [Actinoplanes consettensis]GIM68379.1 hypothetical protein Aco04nite_10440 [Actinoplanes consettensis]
MNLSASYTPLAAHQLLLFLLQVGLLLGIALVLGRLALRLGMPALVGELTAGVLLGPSLLGNLAPSVSHLLMLQDSEQRHLVDAVGQIGVLLLVGVTGSQLDLSLLRRRPGTALWVSGSGLLVPLAGGLALGALLPGSALADPGQRPVFALFLGVAMAVSAIPVIAKTLLEMRLLHRDIGQLIIGAAVLDDIVGWLLLSVASAMATTGWHGPDLALSVGLLVALIGLSLTLGRALLRPALRYLDRRDEPGLDTAFCVVVVVLLAALTHALKMEPVVGAFLGGMLLGSTGMLNHRRLVPLRTVVLAVLAPLFFATVGLQMNLTLLAEPGVLLVALVVLAVAIGGKFVGAYVGARIARLSHWEGLAVGAGLNARGVIEIIVATVGLRLGVLTPAMFTVIVLVALVTSLMAPVLLRRTVRHIPVTTDDRVREQTLAV